MTDNTRMWHRDASAQADGVPHIIAHLRMEGYELHLTCRGLGHDGTPRC
jgi:hypothetical protein